MDKYFSQSTSSSDAKPKLAKLKKYDDSYIEFGSIEKSDETKMHHVSSDASTQIHEASQAKAASAYKACRI